MSVGQRNHSSFNLLLFLLDIDEKEELEDAAGELAKIADEVPFVPSELQTDCPGEGWPLYMESLTK